MNAKMLDSKNIDSDKEVKPKPKRPKPTILDGLLVAFRNLRLRS